MSKDITDELIIREETSGYSFEKSGVTMEQDINKLMEELTNVRPDELSTEGLKLFNKINEIIDKNKELEENSIPVSLVEETIEELDIKITYIESQYTNGGQNCNSNYLSALYQKQVLQELLEKR